MDPNEPNLAGLPFIDAAVEIANSLETREREEIMIAAAANYSTLCLLDDAIKSADEISDSYSRDTAIAQIAVSAVACESDADPLSLIESIEDPAIQNLALEEISVKYGELNSFDTALEVCRRLEDGDSALARIVPIVGQENSLEWSEELVQEINDNNTRTKCLIELATTANESNRIEQSGHLLLQAEAEVENLEFIEDRVYQLIAIADVYAELNQPEKAKEILLRALRLCGEIEGSSSQLGKSFSKDVARLQVAAGFARSGDYDQAELLIEQIENPFEFARASTELAIEHHNQGRDTRALQLLSEADELITSEECYGTYGLQLRDSSLIELSLAYGTLRDYKKGLQKALLISNPEQQLTALIDVGRNAALAGFTDSIFEIHDALSGDYARATYLVLVSDALLKSGNKELAVRLLMPAVEEADKIQRMDQKCLIMIQASFGLIEAGLEAKANEMLLNVLNTAVDLQDAHQQAQIVIAMAEPYRRHARQLSSDEKQLLAKLAILPR